MKIFAVHFLHSDMRSLYGTERPWEVGETRAIDGELVLCERGYHYCHDWGAALRGGYLYGPMACIVEVDDAGPKDENKGVSATRRLVEVYNVEREMRLFAADEAERALWRWQNRTGKVAGARSWAAVKAARAYADGLISPDQLDAARPAAWDAARPAAWDAAWDAARPASVRRFVARMDAATGWVKA